MLWLPMFFKLHWTVLRFSPTGVTCYTDEVKFDDQSQIFFLLVQAWCMEDFTKFWNLNTTQGYVHRSY